MRDRWRWAVLVVLVIAAFAGGAIKERMDQATVARPSMGPHDELPAKSFVTMIDEAGGIIGYTGHILAMGDEFITEQDRWYRVSEVAENKARCKPVGALPPLQEGIASSISLEQAEFPQPSSGPAVGGSAVEGPAGGARAPGGAAGTIGIYHTHSDESYEPTEGTESVQSGKGGVLKVGSALKEALKSKMLTAVQDTTSHAPHDAMAYSRSRRTAMNLMRQARLALFDVHRDAAPPGQYDKEVAGRKVTQIMLVVGRQNPKYQSNLEFARRLKAAADKAHSGLIKGILIAKGAFNQDLSDRALLLEVGADSNSRADAERAVQLLADDIPKVVGASTQPGGGLTGTTGAQGRSAARALGGIILVLAVGVVGYLLVSTGGLREAASKISKFEGRELANFLGGRSRRKRSGDSDGDKDENRGGCGS